MRTSMTRVSWSSSMMSSVSSSSAWLNRHYYIYIEKCVYFVYLEVILFFSYLAKMIIHR